MKTVHYEAHVTGSIWEPGFNDCQMVYSFDHLPTAKEIKSKAGDFQSISGLKVYCIEATYSRKRVKVN